MLSWERLRIFAALAKHGSITAAAEDLHLTRPAVSQQLRKLEREARCQLVEPDGRGIRLTAAGEIVAQSATSLANTISDTERDLAVLGGQAVGPFRIGSVASALRALLPRVLHILAASHPRLTPSLIDGEVVDMIPELRARRLDVVLAESWSHRPAHMPTGVEFVEVHTEDVQLAVSAHHPLAERSTVQLNELGQQRWVAGPTGTEDHEALLQALRSRNLDSEIPYRVGDYATQLELVAANLAVALVPRLGRVPCPPGVRFLQCEPVASRTVGVVIRSGPVTPAERAFIDEITRIAGERVGPDQEEIP